jgi:hypothetical protein
MPLISTLPLPAMLATKLVMGATVETIRTFRPVMGFVMVHAASAAFDSESSTVGSIAKPSGGSVTTTAGLPDPLEHAPKMRTRASTEEVIFMLRMVFRLTAGMANKESSNAR